VFRACRRLWGECFTGLPKNNLPTFLGDEDSSFLFGLADNTIEKKQKTPFIPLQNKHVFLYDNTIKHELKPHVEKEIDKLI